jgi:dipeptidyl aminopeptidase/acylaminoacyl peptidase
MLFRLLFKLIIITSIFLPLRAFALVYDEADVLEDKIFVTRVEFEKTSIFECGVKCKKIKSLPTPPSKSVMTLLAPFGKNLPPVLRARGSEDGRYIGAWRSDGKTRIIQIVDLVKQTSFIREEKISNETLQEETRLLVWKDSTLFFLSDKDGHNSIYKIDASDLNTPNFEGEKVINGNFSVGEFLPLENGKIAFIANISDPYLFELFIKDVNGAVATKIDSDVSYGNAIVKKGDQIFYSKRGSFGFGVFSYNLKTKKINPLPLPKPKASKHLEAISYETVKFGDLNGSLLKPKTPNETGTLIIWLHGGPHRQASKVLHPFRSYGVYDSTLSYITNETQVSVLKLDYPGSVGHGKNLSESIYQNVGSIDVEKTLEAIEIAKEKLGAKKVYVVGPSYGGYLALKIASKNSPLIDGVFSVNGVTDWRNLFNQIQGSPLIALFGKNKTEVSEELWAAAGIYADIQNTDNKKPIVIGFGNQDRNVPFAQSVAMINFLKANKKNVKEVVFKNEGHALLKKSSVKQFCLEVLKLIGEKKKSCDF